MNKELGKLISK